ncbi:MAG: DUF423 domain-containing protein, partial [Bacteroidia bacterium]|nr:DUF423 domain-containing protein [Bacteroidia bacterium]
MNSKWIIVAASLGVLAVGIGAFGAHGLKPHLEAHQIEIFKTGSHYHFYHVLGLLLVGILYLKKENRLLDLSAYFFVAGIILFSGSLYLLASRELLALESWTWLG